MKFDRNKLFKLKTALLSLSETATEEGVMLITDSDMAVGVEVFVNGEDGLQPASDGEYNANGEIITVEGGIVTNIAAKPAETVEETPAETEPEPETEPVVTEETEPEPEAEPETEPEPETEETPAETEEEDVDTLKARIAELEALVAELEAKLKEPVAESVEEEMKKQEKRQTGKTMDYMAAIKKAREINIKRK